ncbi:MAG TPA: transposase [Chloroflexia bacterium]|nr:transposase [Chloroflexia bacterium]
MRTHANTQQEDSILEIGKQASPVVSEQLGRQLWCFVAPLLVQLDKHIDKRLVRSFLGALHIIVQFRNRPYGLLLSELGSYLLSADKAPAGTKRLSNLLRSPQWHHSLIEQFLWSGAEHKVAALAEQGEDVLLMWDDSELEKAESIDLEGLCAVRSSKAARLKRVKPGYYNPPGGPGGRPVFVPGMHWLTLLMVGRGEKSGPPWVAAMKWWTTRGRWASDKRSEHSQLLKQSSECWGQGVVHLFDRGFAGGPWLSELFGHAVRFVMRWPKGYNLLDQSGVAKKAWQHTRGKPSHSHRQVWDTRHGCYRRTGVVVVRVRHSEYPAPLWLVVSRPGKGREPWYLLTNEPVLTNGDAWRVVFAYARRWQIEMSFRYGKSELAMESPRLWKWESRLKLLGMVALVYAFLLSLLDASHQPLKQWLLRFWCHRNGKRNRDASVPLYRLRSAISRLWLDFRPPDPSLIFP